ncbi:MAG: FAD:protein FMN transferase [Candidatus Marinimicrobia bacterium]|nr:FAD:protein FMN transferase [Candidatus Neomarinimicrobiota bacterium]
MARKHLEKGPALVETGAVSVHKYSRSAMGTIFELFLDHEEQDYASQAAAACFESLEEIELELSRFLENSDISRIVALQRNEKLTLGRHAYACLALSQKMTRETGGAFDVAYLSRGVNTGTREHRAKSRGKDPIVTERPTNIPELFTLDPANGEIRSLTEALTLDLGGIGKGYALDCMAHILNEWGLQRALLQGGRSSVLAMDAPQGQAGWHLAISDPDGVGGILARLNLRNRALGASGILQGPHIKIPASFTGRHDKPVRATWTIGTSAAEMDAFSTAAMLIEEQLLIRCCQKFCPAAARLESQPEMNDTAATSQLMLYGPEQDLFSLEMPSSAGPAEGFEQENQLL